MGSSSLYFALISTVLAGICSARYQPLPMVSLADCTVSPACDAQSKYRPIDGSCSNLKHPSWGQAGTSYARFLPAKYQDKDEPRKSVKGQSLPNVRKMSTSFFPDRNVPDKYNTLNLMQFGQVIAHDITHLIFRQTANGQRAQCCTSDNKPANLPGVCLPIEVSADDQFYKQFNVTCLPFTRARLTNNNRCPKTNTEQENGNTHIIDGSLLYGSNADTAKRLRATNDNGKMLVQTTQDGRKFPPNAKNPTIPCNNRGNESVCYDTGDDRGNQNTDIVVYQIILLRLHNYLCDELVKINPTWKEEKLYLEARRIVGAILQHITFKHFLPNILGKDFMKKKGINYVNCKECCVNYYDPNINPATFNEFSGAAYRSFHSLVPRSVLFADKDYKTTGQINLDDFYFRPSIVQDPQNLDKLMRGLVSQPEESQDLMMTVALTQFFNKGNNQFGNDIESVDLQRSIDLGLATYNEVRKACGLKSATSFEDFADTMSQESIKKLKVFYTSPEDVDLFSGGMMENLVPGTLVGPTFQCIIGEQFFNYMRGDHLYYENCGQPTSFTQEQRNQIYRATLAWIFCKFGDNIESIQLHTFHFPSTDNPILPCKKIPAPDFTLWKE